MPEAVLFATDSRITYPHEYQDVGPKLFELSPNSGVVYAGWVESGLGCISSFQSHFRSHTYQKPLDAVAQMQLIVRKNHRSMLKRHNRERGFLQLLIGIYDIESNAAKLFRLESNSLPPFKAEEVEGLNAIGNPQAVAAFRQKFEELVESEMGRPGPVPDSPMDWLNFITTVLENVAKEEMYRGIGGLVQTAILGRDGFSWVTRVVIKPDDKMIVTERAKDRWRQTDESGRLIQQTDPSLDPGMRKLWKISD